MAACAAQLRRAITPFPAALETQFLERFRSLQLWSISVLYLVCGFFFLLGIPAWMQTRIFVAGTEQQEEIPDRDLYLAATLIVDTCGVRTSPCRRRRGPATGPSRKAASCVRTASDALRAETNA